MLTPMSDKVVSKRSYKKLGTIFEHLTKNVNPMFYEIRVVFTQNPQSAYIRIYPINLPINTIVYPVWELVWTPYFNDQLIIDTGLLSQYADW